MKREDISLAVGDIDTAYIEEAAEEPFKHPSVSSRGKWILPLAACFLLICTAVWSLPAGVRGDTCPAPANSSEAIGESGSADQKEVGSAGTDGSAECESQKGYDSLFRELQFNEAYLLSADGEIDLSVEDFVPMSREALLHYFDTTLPVSKVLPELHAQSPDTSDYGIYRRSGGSGNVYRDGNVFPFVSSDGRQQVDIILSKACHHAGMIPELAEGGSLHTTPVNGRDLTVFRAGKLLYVEWMQAHVGWQVQADGLSDEDFVQLLTALVQPVEPVAEQTLTGQIHVIDPRAHAVQITAEDGTGVRVRLPEDFAIDTLHLGDRAAVTWRGECATLQTVWAEQLVEFTT